MEQIADRPAFADTEAGKIALKRFGIQAETITPLPSERDQNFKLVQGQQAFVLKIANANAAFESIQFQNQLMATVADSASSPGKHFSAPNIFSGLSGETVCTIEDSSGKKFLVRAVEYLPGIPMAEFRPLELSTFFELGLCLGNLSKTLATIQPPLEDKPFDWDLDSALAVVEKYQAFLNQEDSQRIAPFVESYRKHILPIKDSFRRSVIHNDANDFNVILSRRSDDLHYGLIDFGDATHSQTVNELAIAIAYSMLNTREPLEAATEMVRGYHQNFALTETELGAIFQLACMRLCVSLCISAKQSKETDDPYLSVTAQPARRLLDRLAAFHPRMVEASFRMATGLSAFPEQESFQSILQNGIEIAPIMGTPLTSENCQLVDLSVATQTQSFSTDLPGMRAYENWILSELENTGKSFGIGRYDEPRLCYLGEQFMAKEISETRTIHLGIDIFAAAGAVVHAPLQGRVHSFQDNNLPLDYGPTIILEHEIDGITFYTLYGHLSRDSISNLKAGQEIAKGEAFCRFGAIQENGNWPAHLHFQIILDMLDKTGDFPGVGDAKRRSIWKALCPDPNNLLGLEKSFFIASELEVDHANQILEQREKLLNPSLSLSYDEPIHIVRGKDQFLIDSEGRTYLDMVNNVCHVGHANPRVVAAINKQASILNTNTRYLHQNLTRLASRLTETMPDHLRVCFFVNSGSEANDLALRLARNFTGRESVVCLDGAYHGNLSSLIDISPYKFNSPGGSGCPPNTFVAPMPDPFRGKFRIECHSDSKGSVEAEQACCQSYLGELDATFAEAVRADLPPAALIAEPILSCGGQVVPPKGFLQSAFEFSRSQGALAISDEVQIGFGRVGKSYWGFQAESAIPDIVTMGKPIANGHPMGAVVTTMEIAEAFNNGMEYFNTFGGNPVSCAACLAVLEEIEDRQLIAAAQKLGDDLMESLSQMQSEFPVLGDVRGRGLFIGVEFVHPGTDRDPFAAAASYVVQQMKRFDQILLSTDGPDHNVIKIKPPLVIQKADLDRFLFAMRRVLADLPKLRTCSDFAAQDSE